MIIKKTLGIVLAASMLTATMAGCGNKSATTSSAGTDSTGKVVTLNAIMLKHPLTQDLAKMEWLTKIEKEAGVSIKWQQISADWDQKKEHYLQVEIFLI